MGGLRSLMTLLVNVVEIVHDFLGAVPHGRTRVGMGNDIEAARIDRVDRSACDILGTDVRSSHTGTHALSIGGSRGAHLWQCGWSVAL